MIFPTSSRRLAIVSGLGAAWVLLIAARLYDLQVVRYEHFAGKAERQQQRVVTLDPPRGTIYDAHGRELAVSVQVDSAYAVPPEIKDPAGTARKIGAVVPGLDVKKLARHLSGDRDFVWVARKLDPPVAARVHALDLPGIYFLPESKRYYPMRELAAQVLGYVGTDNQGLAGLELVYDKEIAGKPGVRTVLRDARRGTVILPGLGFVEPKPGQDLRITLDASIQFFAEHALEESAKDLGGSAYASVILMRPSDGSILALATYPSFDLNKAAAYPVERQRLRTIRDTLATGSLVLLVAAAASVEAGLRTPQEFRGFESAADQAAAAALLGSAARSPTVYEQLQESGFGQLTGIDLPGEGAGFFEPPAPGDGEDAQKPYAKLIVTPVQLATALTQLINGGLRIRPNLVRRPLSASKRLLSPRTVQAQQRFWRREALLGRDIGPSSNLYLSAGLRGRAVGPLDGPSDPMVLDTYFGFAPASEPLFSGLVITAGLRGDTERHGMAEQVFQQIAFDVLRYLRRSAEPQDSRPWPNQNRGF